MPVRLTILGSGSSGNCAFLETSETRLLIDAGLSGRQIRQRLLSIGRAPENLSGILITHEHSDHIQGLVGLAARLNIPIYCNRLTRDAIVRQLQIPLDFRLFATGASFDVGDLAVDSFSVPHDAYDPVGFLLRTNEGNIGFLTDLGHATHLVLQRIRSAHILLLETNYDLKLLQEDTRRPWSVKQRITSRHGHLSNEAAAEVAAQVLSADLRHLYLGHLSSDCNRPELARLAMKEILEKNGATHTRLEVALQSVPCQTLCLGGGVSEYRSIGDTPARGYPDTPVQLITNPPAPRPGDGVSESRKIGETPTRRHADTPVELFCDFSPPSATSPSHGRPSEHA